MTSQRTHSGNNCGRQSEWFRLPSMWGALLVGLLLAAPGVLGQTSVDFFCNAAPSSACTGTIVQSTFSRLGLSTTAFSSSGITLFNDNGPFSSTTPFTLSFDTATFLAQTFFGEMRIAGNGVDFRALTVSTAGGGTGPYTLPTSSLSFAFSFSYQPYGSKIIGEPGQAESGQAVMVYFPRTGAVESVDLVITPTPEPASMLLVGSGFLAMGGMLRKRRTKA